MNSIDDVIAFLYSKKVLSQNDKHQLKSYNTDVQRISEVLDFISRGPEEHYKYFVEALKKTNQFHLVRMLEMVNVDSTELVDAKTGGGNVIQFEEKETQVWV